MFVAHLDDLRHEFDFDVLLAGIPDVRIVDGRDTVGENLFRGDVGAQRMYGDDHQLEERIVAFDVERRVAFGEAERLRPEKSEVNRLLGDATKLRTLTDWKPQYTFEQGLAETIEFLRGNLDQYKVGQYIL